MSIKIMQAVWDRAPYSGGTLLVLLALSDWSNDDGVCFPKIEQLARKARLSVRATQTALRALEAENSIIREAQGIGRGNRVTFRVVVQNLHLFSKSEKVQNHVKNGAVCDSAPYSLLTVTKTPPYPPFQGGDVENPSNEETPAAAREFCTHCAGTGTYESPAHPGREIYCGCAAGVALQRVEKPKPTTSSGDTPARRRRRAQWLR